MKVGKRIMYATMNSWNNQDSLAYNLKVYNVIRKDLRNKAYEIMSDESLSSEIYENESVDDLLYQRTKDNLQSLLYNLFCEYKTETDDDE